MVFTEMCIIKAGYLFVFFRGGGQILKALKFCLNFGQFYAKNALNNLD
jgi:hypothetical protein